MKIIHLQYIMDQPTNVIFCKCAIKIAYEDFVIFSEQVNLWFQFVIIIKFVDNFISSMFKVHFFYLTVRRVEWRTVSMLIKKEIHIIDLFAIDMNLYFLLLAEYSIWSKTCKKRCTLITTMFLSDNNGIWSTLK